MLSLHSCFSNYIVLADESCDVSKVKVNKTLRKNLRVRLGDTTRVQPHGMDIPFGKHVHILPMEDTVGEVLSFIHQYNNCIHDVFDTSFRKDKWQSI